MQNDKPPSSEDFDERLRAAQERRPGGVPGKGTGSGADEPKRGSGLSLAFRIGVELVAALIVGVGIGLLLDHWLGTKPWFLLLFFVLGSAAGIVNVFRAVGGYGYAAGYSKPGQNQKAPGRETKDD